MEGVKKSLPGNQSVIATPKTDSQKCTKELKTATEAKTLFGSRQINSLLATSPGEIIYKNLIFPPSVQDREQSVATAAALADSHSGIVLRMLHFLYNAPNFAVAS